MSLWNLLIVVQISFALIDFNDGIGGIVAVESYQCEHDVLPHLPRSGACTWPNDQAASESSKCTHERFQCNNVTMLNPVEWNLQNKTFGRLDIKYPLLRDCAPIRYTVQLLVAEGAGTAEECLMAKAFKTHSERTLQIRDGCVNPVACHTCSKKGLAKFQFVFTGCYKVTVQAGIYVSESCPKFLETDYKKQCLSKVTPSFDSRFKDNTIIVSIHYPPLLCNLLKMDIILMANVSMSCYQTGHKHTICNLEPNKKPDCNPRNELQRNLDTTPECTIDKSRIDCIFPNVDSGNHCIRLDITDDRCKASTTWAEYERAPCQWCFEYNASDEVKGKEMAPDYHISKSHIIIACLLLVAFFVAILVAACVLYKIYKSRRPRPAFSSPSVNRLPLQPASNIILLYARDCNPFMKLMQSFRQMLEEMALSEVYDCYDPERIEEVSRNPIEWMRRLVTSQDTKIVVVASKCAALRQKAQFEREVVCYKVPTAFDDLFLYGLQAIDGHPTSDAYQRVFVVRFEAFSEDADLLAHLNSYTRFVLPLHLDKLIDHLHQPSFSDQSLQLKATGELENVLQDLRSLIKYRDENANYLQDILMLQRSL